MTEIEKALDALVAEAVVSASWSGRLVQMGNALLAAIEADRKAEWARGYERAREEAVPPPVCTGSGYPVDYFGRCGICKGEVMAPNGLCATHPYRAPTTPASTTTPVEAVDEWLKERDASDDRAFAGPAPTPPVPPESAKERP